MVEVNLRKRSHSHSNCSLSLPTCNCRDTDCGFRENRRRRDNKAGEATENDGKCKLYEAGAINLKDTDDRTNGVLALIQAYTRGLESNLQLHATPRNDTS
jgi:hypothetical protein